jgi:hypothetical protein
MSQVGFVISSEGFFQEAVDEACAKRKLVAVPAVKEYLVQLMQHYLHARNLFEQDVNETNGKREPSTLAEMLLLAGQAPLTEKQGLLKKLGDRSLYISGFFGDSLERKMVDIDYYAEMGGTAYGYLAECVHEDTVAHVYKTFSQRFLEFVDVLTYISHQSMVQNDQNILRLYDLYLRTGSELAREKLVEVGVVTLPLDQSRLVRQDD